MPVQSLIKDTSQIRKLLVSALYLIGASVSSYYLVAFKTDKFGLYYKDGDQFGLSIGVGMLVLGWIIRNWKKI